jgi:hypothetical protein
LEREALILDRAIDFMLAGGETVISESSMPEAAGVARAVASIPAPARAGEAYRAMMDAAVVGFAPRRRFRWFAAVPLAAMLCVGGVAYAARNAAPGDALWSLRRGAQASRVVFAGSEAARADARLDRAAGDLALARRLAAGREARSALKIFWTDLNGARSAIALLPAADRAPRLARADALAADAAAFEELLETRAFRDGSGSASPDDGNRGPGSVSDDSSGSGTSGSSSGSDSSGSGSGESGSGSDDSRSSSSGPGSGD